MPLNIDGIAFDVGNTLILDPFDDVLRSKSLELRRTFSGYGYGFTEKEIRDSWAEANRKIHYPFICHFYQETPIIKHCLTLLKVSRKDIPVIATDLLVVYRNGLKSAVMGDERMAAISGALSRLRDSGKRLIVFSNGRQKSIELFLRWTGIAQYFKFVSTSEKIGIEKPRQEAFNYMMKLLAVQRERSMYIGDDVLNDIMPAKDAGMKTCLYIPPRLVSAPWRDYDSKTVCHPDAVIRRFEELPEIIS